MNNKTNIIMMITDRQLNSNRYINITKIYNNKILLDLNIMLITKVIKLQLI